MSVTGLILSGGLGRRMGAVDKGLQSFHGRPMVEQVIERFAPQVDKLAINANQHLDTYQDFGLPVWPDEMQGFPGPLAGLQAGLTHCDTPYLVTVPCDSPFLPMNLVERLMTTMQTEHADIAYVITGTAEARQAHPVFCLIKVSLLPLLTAYLESGGRKMETWMRSLYAAEVHFADEAAFQNINTLEELRKCEMP